MVNGELGQFALHHQRFMWLPCFCFPCRTSLQYSIFTCYVLSIAYESSYLYGIFYWYYPSSPPQVLRLPRPPLETGGLAW